MFQSLRKKNLSLDLLSIENIQNFLYNIIMKQTKKQQLIKIAQDIVNLEKEYKEEKSGIIEKEITKKITNLSLSDMLFIDDYIMKNNLLTK